MTKTLEEKTRARELRKKFLKYLLPSVSAMWVYSLYTIVDGIFVSKGVGPNAMAAVNISMPFVSFIFAVSLLFSTGASTMIAIELGRGNSKKANKIFSLNMVTIIILSLIILFVSSSNVEKLAIFLGATEHTLAYVKDYIRIIGLFNGFFIVSYSLEVIVKTDGFPHFAIIGVTLSAIMNIVLDYIFIMKLHLGVPGAAYATGISQVASSIFFITHFIKKNSKLSFVKFRINFSILKKILFIGFPDFITELSGGIVIFLFNQSILKYIGESGVIAYSIVSYVSMIVINTMVGVTQGMQPLSSYYYGKKDKRTVYDLLRMSLKGIFTVSTIAFFIVIIFTKPIVSLFIGRSDKYLFKYSVKVLRIFSLSFLIAGYNINMSGFFASVAKPRYSTIISLGRGLVIIGLCLFTMPLILGSNGIWIAPIVSELICLMISFSISREKLEKRFLIPIEKTA